MRAQELYTSVTNRIIEDLRKGTPTWVRPWKDAKGLNRLPGNASTGRPYSGVNVLILYMEAMEKGYASHGWMTFTQANQVGAKVRKGEKASHVVFVKHVEKDDDGEKKKSTILKTYPVFNLSQLDDVPALYLAEPEKKEPHFTYMEAIKLLNGTGAEVTHGGNKAAYYPQRDMIVLPSVSQFESEDAYWGTAAHELSHWTGHKSRLNRTLGKRFGDKAYATEELIAELSSAFICARIGIPASFRSASYIANWLEVLENDNRAVFTAASYASQAADYAFKLSAQAEASRSPEISKSEQEMEDSIVY